MAAVDSVGLISAMISVFGAFLTGILAYWHQQRAKTVARRNYMDHYGASLAWAAFDLQSRVFNLLKGHGTDTVGEYRGFLTSLITRGTAEEAEYARRSTVFVFAEYLAWVEILRRDIQFLELGKDRLNRTVMAQIVQISQTLNEIHGRRPSTSNEFRIFRAAQRAIGELMIHPVGEPGKRQCRGYADFCGLLDEDEAFKSWFSVLLSDVDRFVEASQPAVLRLTKLQHELVELIEILDPRFVRLPKELRSRFGESIVTFGQSNTPSQE